MTPYNARYGTVDVIVIGTARDDGDWAIVTQAGDDNRFPVLFEDLDEA